MARDPFERQQQDDRGWGSLFSCSEVLRPEISLPSLNQGPNRTTSGIGGWIADEPSWKTRSASQTHSPAIANRFGRAGLNSVLSIW